jgi:hypothetical protein
VPSFHGVEALAGSVPPGSLQVAAQFSDDALDYFTERRHPDVTRQAAAQARAFDVTLEGVSAGTNRPTYISEIGYNSPFLEVITGTVLPE